MSIVVKSIYTQRGRLEVDSMKDNSQESMMEALWRSSHISGGNAVYVEGLYEDYLQDPNSVPEEWKDFFNKIRELKV